MFSFSSGRSPDEPGQLVKIRHGCGERCTSEIFLGGAGNHPPGTVRCSAIDRVREGQADVRSALWLFIHRARAGSPASVNRTTQEHRRFVVVGGPPGGPRPQCSVWSRPHQMEQIGSLTRLRHFHLRRAFCASVARRGRWPIRSAGHRFHGTERQGLTRSAFSGRCEARVVGKTSITAHITRIDTFGAGSEASACSCVNPAGSPPLGETKFTSASARGMEA